MDPKIGNCPLFSQVRVGCGFALLALLMVVAILVLLYLGASSNFFKNKPFSQSNRSQQPMTEKALIERIQKVVESGGNIDASQNQYKQTLLHIAAKYGFAEAVVLCLDHGANVEAVDYPARMTPLHRAAYNGYAEVFKLLVDHGANVEARAVLERTVLDSAIDAEVNREDIIAMLLAAGADVNARDEQGMTPIFWSIPAGDPNVVKLLIEHGASARTRGYLNTTPLHDAAFYGQQEIAELLIEYGAYINARSDEGLTPLDCALGKSFSDISIYDKERVAGVLRAHGAKRGSEL